MQFLVPIILVIGIIAGVYLVHKSQNDETIYVVESGGKIKLTADGLLVQKLIWKEVSRSKNLSEGRFEFPDPNNTSIVNYNAPQNIITTDIVQAEEIILGADISGSSASCPTVKILVNPSRTPSLECKTNSDCKRGQICQKNECPQTQRYCPPGTDQSLCKPKSCPGQCAPDSKKPEPSFKPANCPEPPRCDGQLIIGDPKPDYSNKCSQYRCVKAQTGNGDGNNDGKVDLVDLSILLTDFNKNGGFRTGIDLNGDGAINTFDFSLIRNLLIEKRVIKG